MISHQQQLSESWAGTSCRWLRRRVKRESQPTVPYLHFKLTRTRLNIGETLHGCCGPVVRMHYFFMKEAGFHRQFSSSHPSMLLFVLFIVRFFCLRYSIHHETDKIQSIFSYVHAHWFYYLLTSIIFQSLPVLYLVRMMMVPHHCHCCCRLCVPP